jgi:multimeric flavodoxin WrbA
MKISFINGSPKNRNSVSGSLLKALENVILESDIAMNFDISNFKISSSNFDLSQYDAISQSDILVFAFPLYIDSVPSHVVKWLSLFENFFSNKKIKVFAIINCGFYEGSQSKNAISIMKNWTNKANLIWGQGMGVGAGPMFFFEKMIKSNGKDIIDGLKRLHAVIFTKGSSEDDIYTIPNVPRFVYKLSSENAWRQAIRKNGGNPKDLSKKL